MTVNTTLAGLAACAALASACSPDKPFLGPAVGVIEVTATTTGAQVDEDGYTVVVDGGTGRAIAVNGAMTFSGLSAGVYLLTAREGDYHAAAGDETSTGGDR